MLMVNPEAVARMTRNGAAVITSVDDGITALLGWSPDDFVGVPSTTFLHPADQANAIAGWMAMITKPGVTHVWRGRYRTADGSWRWVETLNVSDGAEQPTVVTTMKAVAHDEVTAEEERLAREQLLTQLGDALPVGVFQIDRAHHVTFANDRFVALTGG